MELTCKINKSAIINSIRKLLSPFDISCRLFDGNTIVLHKEKKVPEVIKNKIIVKQNVQETDTVNLIVEPKNISKDNPIYPAAAINKNIEGKVKIKLKINKEGAVCKSFIELSSGSAILDSATTAYSNKLKFTPALENGKPTDMWLYMTFKYILNEKPY